MKDSKLQSILKAISWRVVGSLDTIIVCYVVAGDIRVAISIGSIELVSKMILYYLHERVWNHLKWGKL